MSATGDNLRKAADEMKKAFTQRSTDINDAIHRQNELEQAERDTRNQIQDMERHESDLRKQAGDLEHQKQDSLKEATETSRSLNAAKEHLQQYTRMMIETDQMRKNMEVERQNLDHQISDMLRQANQVDAI